jgi:asparagine N-glycosylation enzyme membrane subunit Stt3
VNQEPSRWLDRLVGACFSVLLGALALYAAVWLLQAIWPALLMVVFVASCIVGLVALWRMRQGRW